jgi:hypothetical protein
MNLIKTCKTIGTGLAATALITVASTTNLNLNTQVTNNSPIISITSLGEPADAKVSPVITKTFRFGWKWIKEAWKWADGAVTVGSAADMLGMLEDKGVQDDLIVFADKSNVEWSEATQICDRQQG